MRIIYKAFTEGVFMKTLVNTGVSDSAIYLLADAAIRSNIHEISVALNWCDGFLDLLYIDGVDNIPPRERALITERFGIEFTRLLNLFS